MKISEASLTHLKEEQARIGAAISSIGSHEAAAQKFTSMLYEGFRESIVLVRSFLSIRYENLPEDVRGFVDTLAAAKGVANQVDGATLVLTLLGTSGAKPEWNDRRRSAGHVGIPLVSAAFIDAIPMMSRLLKQLGLGLEWIDSRDSDLVMRTTGRMSGTFFVPDATTEVDHQGRNIIAAQDFVSAEGVETVFGFGGGYLGTDNFCVTIIFLREAIDKTKAEQFAGMMAFFKADTVDVVKAKKLFA